jgi:hypothetical protein
MEDLGKRYPQGDAKKKIILADHIRDIGYPNLQCESDVCFIHS